LIATLYVVRRIPCYPASLKNPRAALVMEVIDGAVSVSSPQF